MKKAGLIVLLFVLGFVVAACNGEGNEAVFEVNESDLTMNEGESHELDVTFSNTELHFESSDTSVLTVDSNGLITAVSPGEAGVVIIATDTDFDPVEITITVLKVINLDVNTDTIDLTEGETAVIDYTANTHVVFTSSDESVFTVDETGAVSAIGEGTATLTITAKDDTDVQETITVRVARLIILEGPDSAKLWVDGTLALDIVTNDTLTYVSSDTDVVRVTQDGTLTGLATGEAIITITAHHNAAITHEITVGVYLGTELIFITGDETVNLGTEGFYAIEVAPEEGYPVVTFTTSDDSVAVIDDNGVLTPLSTGTVTITATSQFTGNDKPVEASKTVEIVHHLAVDTTSSDGDTREVGDFVFAHGSTLFDCIEDALENSADGVHIHILEGTFTNGFTVNVDGATLSALEGVFISGDVTVSANDVTIEGFIWQDGATITNEGPITGFAFTGNTVTLDNRDFLVVSGSKDILISGNSFTGTNRTATGITITDAEGLIRIEKNTMTDLDRGVHVTIKPQTDVMNALQIERNTIDETTLALYIDLDEQAMSAYVRFNDFHEVDKFVTVAEQNSIDFTLNYWNGDTPASDKFDNVTDYYLRGYYLSVSDIPNEADYNPDIPAQIIITNPVEELIIGDSHTLEYEFLPLDFHTDRIQFITSNPDVLMTTQSGVLTPVGSGPVTITIRSRLDLTVNARIAIDVTTTPGIELTPSHVMNTITPDDYFILEAKPFPYDIRDANVLFESSDPALATIAEDGHVEAYAPGIVTFTARLENNPDVTQEFTIEIHESLDENDLLDLLTKYSVSYSTPHRWTAYGFSFNYQDFRYESVSRFYFSDPLEINQKIVPVSHGVRPGEPMTPHPEGVEAYNDDNVYWVVIHDTANTAPGAGALSHANYLYNAAVNGHELWVSWHYTIDDTLIYQHLPENERGFHAGDGSSLPHQRSDSYLGGGNRNGIGIEMSPNQDGDMYRTWQRTAQLSADILYRYNLPLDHLTYHIDFSGKICPQTLIRAGLIPVFEEMVEIEYFIRHNFQDASISFESHNPDYIDQHGRVVAMPDRAMTASYTVTVVQNGVERSRTFNVYLPGTIH